MSRLSTHAVLTLESMVKSLKAWLRHYLGRDLPRRRLDLNFVITPPSRRAKKPPLTKTGLSKRLPAADDDPTARLRILAQLTRDLNRYALSVERRMLLTQYLVRQWIPLYYLSLHRYAQKGGIPDDVRRLEQLDYLAEGARALAISYQIIFQTCYDRSRFRYARSRDRIHLSAFRILELIKLEQRARGLRYRELSGRAWQDVNTVFHAMLAYESVDFPLPLLENLQADRNSRALDSPHGLYVAIQTFSLLDFSRWPVRYQSFIDTYLSLVDQAVTVEPADAGGGEDSYYAYCYQDSAAEAQWDPRRRGPAVVLNCSVLLGSIRLDFRDLVKAARDNNPFLIPPKLSALQPEYRFFITRMMLENATGERWRASAGQLADEAPGLRIYSGVRDIYAHLQSVFHGTAQSKDARGLTDVLAQRSALIGEDQSATEKSQWHVLQRSAKRLRLRTQETRFNVPMHIGSLIAYGFDAEEIERPHLGAVTRILRTDTRTVVVDLDYIASYAEPVGLRKHVVIDDSGEALPKSKSVGAFLVHDKIHGWGVLAPANAPFGAGAWVTAQRGKQQQRWLLGPSRTVTANLFLYRLEKQEQRLGEPLYPSQRVVQPMEPESVAPEVLELPDLLSVPPH